MFPFLLFLISYISVQVVLKLRSHPTLLLICCYRDGGYRNKFFVKRRVLQPLKDVVDNGRASLFKFHQSKSTF